MFLGIDVGTSSVKAVLIDAAQTMIASAAAAMDVTRPQPGWSEQNADDWLAATGAVLDQLAVSHKSQLAAVTGIGLSGHMHGATLLGADDKPLRPCILWNDGRSAAECLELEAAEPRFRTLGGNIVMPGFTAPKLAWVAKHEPAVFAKLRTVLLPKDYVRLWLTGTKASDMSDSAGTLWLNVATRDWAEPLLAATQLNRGHMPKLYEGSAATGTLRPELAARWGISAKAVVAGGGGDNAASACGVGVVRPGTAFLSLGTSGVLFVSTDRFTPNTDGAVHAFCHAIPNTWHVMGVALSAAGSLDWFAGVHGCSASDLVAEVGDSIDTPSSIVFLPYLSGERTPHNDAAVRGVFAGLGSDTTRCDMTQGLLEGVAYSIADCRDALAKGGATVERVLAVGGGSRSRLWLQIMADVLGVAVDVPAGGEVGAAFGAARLGLCAATGADPLAVCTQPAIEATLTPNPARAEAYAAALTRFRNLYPAIKGVLA